MATKRYLNIDEAAEKLGISKEELNRLRSKGDVRGFADRGTFKFKEEDIDELGRRMQLSSEPDVQIVGADDGSVLDDDHAGTGSGIGSAPSVIRQLSGEDSGINPEGGAGSIFDDFGGGGASDSDVRLVMDDRLGAGHDSGSDVMLQFQESDSDVRLAADSGRINLNDSDSDVRLASDEPTASPDSVLNLGLNDSDSDVRLDDGSDTRFAKPDSDSDVMLAPDNSDSGKLASKTDSDSDVMLVSEEPDSDSDVHLAADDSAVPIGMESDSEVQLIGADSDSDVQLLDDARVSGPRSKIKKDSDSDVAVLPDSGLNLKDGSGIGPKSGVRGAGASVLLDDSDIALDGGSGISLTSQSGINLVGPQSGISLDNVSDSGVSLEKRGEEDDSGLSLFADEDEGGITLADDSGIALQMDDDSGIALSSDEEEEDAGITLAEPGADSGISLKDDDGDLRLTETMPAMKIPKGGKGKKKSADEEDGMSDTMLKVPSLDSEDEAEAAESDFEIGAADGSSTGDTSVLLFDDEDETDDGGAAMVKKKEEEVEDEEAFEFSEAEEEAEAEDVFAGDEAFEEDSEFGEETELEPVAKVAVAATEYPWGGGLISMLAVSSVIMLLCGMASIDLVRSMWGHQGYSPANGWLIETLGGLFK